LKQSKGELKIGEGVQDEIFETQSYTTSPLHSLAKTTQIPFLFLQFKKNKLQTISRIAC